MIFKWRSTVVGFPSPLASGERPIRQGNMFPLLVVLRIIDTASACLGFAHDKVIIQLPYDIDDIALGEFIK